MAPKIKIFKYGDTDTLEAKVNDFCEWHTGTVLNIQYSAIYTETVWYSCCITYTDKTDNVDVNKRSGSAILG